MMNSDLMRILLIVGAVATIVYMLLRIRKTKLQIADTIFWMVLALLLAVISIFPQIAYWASQWLGFEAPINFMYVAIIFVLIIRLFANNLRLSRTDAKVQQLAQRLALYEKREEDAVTAKTKGNETPKAST